MPLCLPYFQSLSPEKRWKKCKFVQGILKLKIKLVTTLEKTKYKMVTLFQNTLSLFLSTDFFRLSLTYIQIHLQWATTCCFFLALVKALFLFHFPWKTSSFHYTLHQQAHQTIWKLDYSIYNIVLLTFTCPIMLVWMCMLTVVMIHFLINFGSIKMLQNSAGMTFKSRCLSFY